jgi:hypothetical protein
LRAQIAGDDTRARLRRQLPSNIFVQSLTGPREHPVQEAAVAIAFLDEAKCLGAQGLSAADKAGLQVIIDAAPKPSPGPGTAASGAVGSR